MTIESGTRVSLEYTLKLEDGTVVESNVGGDRLSYVHGRGEIIPGLEKGIEGMTSGEEREVRVAAEDAYGPVHAEAIQEVPKDRVPDEACKAGAQLQGQTPDGEVFVGRVTDVKDDTVVVDFNHPLAGETLHFHVKVVGVESASDSGEA